MPRKAQTPPADTANVPKIDVLERRLAHPFGAPSVAITLKDGQAWAIRWVSDSVRTGRIHQILGMGWEFVTPEEIDGRPADYGCRVLDGRLVRGEHAEDVLVKMPQAMFDKIQWAKAAKNLENLGGTKGKTQAAEAVAKQFGPEAADTVYRSSMEVNDSREIMDLEGETAPR